MLHLRRLYILMILLLPGWAPPSSEIATKGIPLVRDGKKNYRKGIENEVAGRPDSAFLYFSNALVAFEKESEWDLYSKTCFKLASIKKNARDLRNARAFLRKSDSIRQKFNIRNDSLEAEVYHLKGLLKLMDGQPGIALEDFEQSIRLKKILFGENDTLLAPTYNNMGIIFFNKPDYEEALRYYQLAMNSARGKKANPNPLIPRFTENIGLIYARKGDYNQAMEYFSDALNQKIRISGQNSPDVAISFLNIANLEIDLSNYNIALDYLIKAEKIYIANFGNDYPDLDVVYQNMGKVYNSRSDYEKALNYYNKAIQLLKKKNPNHPRIPELNMNIGYILFVREEYDKALGYYHRSISPDRLSQLNIKVYRNLARCHQRLNHADSALFYYRQSIQISDAMAPGGYEKASGLLYFGEFLQSVGRTNEAEKNIREATRMMETLLGRKNRDLADCYLKLGDLYINTNRPSDALSYFHRAVVALTPGYDEKDIQDRKSVV